MRAGHGPLRHGGHPHAVVPFDGAAAAVTGPGRRTARPGGLPTARAIYRPLPRRTKAATPTAARRSPCRGTTKAGQLPITRASHRPLHRRAKTSAPAATRPTGRRTARATVPTTARHCPAAGTRTGRSPP